ncbi:MAG: shikimate dehydrogenase [Candidatus Berkiellales bacterium]
MDPKPRTVKSYALFGSPVNHSLSPMIHLEFAKQFDLPISYERILTPKGELKTALQAFKERGGLGANITVPLKLEAYQLCDEYFPMAKQAKAVNTLLWEENALWGDNTDGEGLVRDLTVNLGIDLANKRILILGAGGAAQGILLPLLGLGAKIVIVNRTLIKAQALAELAPDLKAYSYETLQQSDLPPFDYVINATSASLQEALPLLSATWIKGTIAIDLAYRLQQETIFMHWAKANGALAAYDGVGMLVEQAALSFKRWHNLMPATQKLIETLRQKS